jgi:hypothetical protein
VTDPGRPYPVALTGLAALLVVNAVLGPAGLDLVPYPLSETLLNQLRGLELVTVLLVAPALLRLRGSWMFARLLLVPKVPDTEDLGPRASGPEALPGAPRNP